MFDKYDVGFWVIAVVCVTIIMCTVFYNCRFNNELLAKQTTCYGKVAQQNWDSSSSEIIALRACDGR